MSQDSDAFIREIDEEVRRERLKKLWKDYGTIFMGTVAAAVVLLAGWQWYIAYQTDRSQTAGSQFQQAVELLEGDKKSDGLAALEQITNEGTPTYAALAKMRLAAEQRDAGENDKAVAAYKAVADDSRVDPILRSFARMQVGSLIVDTGTWTEAENQLTPLAAQDSPWRLTAQELLGVAAYKHEQWADAQKAYAVLLAEPTATPAVRQRAQAALALITREMSKNTPNGKKTDAKPQNNEIKPAEAGTAAKPETVSPAAPANAAPGTSETTTEPSQPASASGSDLKNDKSSGDDAAKAGGEVGAKDAGDGNKPDQAGTPTSPSNGAGSTNDATPKQQ